MITQSPEMEAETRRKKTRQKLKNEQEEIKLEALQPTKRYHANCPYCMGVNPNGSKVCEYCGSSLAYYDEADNK